jgi:ComF family protein
MGNLLLPQTCTGCGSNCPTVDGFCADCGAELLALTAMDYCIRCGESLPAGQVAPGRTDSDTQASKSHGEPAQAGLGQDQGSGGGKESRRGQPPGTERFGGPDGCPACPEVMPHFKQLVRLGPYARPLRQAIGRLKYHGGPASLRQLGVMLALAVRSRLPALPDLVLPVPMHWARRLSRGRNHAADLAQAVARRLGLPIGDELLRVRNTPPQVHLPASRRRENLRGAFKVVRRDTLRSCHVLLIDDVVTTGSTANEAAGTLLQAGAAAVTLAVLAKTPAPAAYSAQLHHGRV